MKTITNINNIVEQAVIVRVDYNVPIAGGIVQDDPRIRNTLPTLQHLIKQNCKIILLSHLGRPKGYDPTLSLKLLAPYLQNLVNTKVSFTQLENLQGQLHNLQAGEIILLENIRFYQEEEKNDLEFAKHLASMADVYVNEAFSCSHRDHASIAAISSLLPVAAGIHLRQEVENLQSIFKQENGPVAAIIGGAKISTKLQLIHHLSSEVDFLIIGGALANNVLQARGFNIGQSLCEPGIKEDFAEYSNIILPQDVITAHDTASDPHTCDIRYIPSSEKIFDIGPASIIRIKNTLSQCKTVLWNGPLGLFEIDKFSKATKEVANTIKYLTKIKKIRSVIGGGDSVFAINKLGISMNEFTYVSTAGGAFLEWLEQQCLPNLKIFEI